MNDELPDVVLMKILGYLPKFSFIQIALVSKRFRDAWIEMKIINQSQSGNEDLIENQFKTNPLLIGNLFPKPWSFTPDENVGLHTSLLKFYVENGYGNMKKVLENAASRGDIEGIHFMVTNEFCALDDDNICTMAGAAGQLKLLRWLRGDIIIEQCKLLEYCPWDPTEVHREAAENSHDDVIEYVEKNSENHHIAYAYSVGLPW